MGAALCEPLTFVSAVSEFCPHPEELKPDGANLVVTEQNKAEYVQLLCEAYLCGGIRREIQCFLKGFWDVLPHEVLVNNQVSARELSVLISGVADLDVAEWRAHAERGSPATGFSQIRDWFWEVVVEMTADQRSMLLQFT